MEFFKAFFGRFHPLLVHLPIGFLILAFLFECLSLRPANRRLRKAVQPALLWGTLFAIAAALSGYLLRQEGGYEDDLADLHQNFGIATVVCSVAVYLLRPRFKLWIADPLQRKRARIVLLLPLIVLLSMTGHWGGSLTHGEDYLSAVVASAGVERPDPVVKIRTIASIPDAVLYRDVIQPILEARCYDCHSSSKQKGDLRLDQETFIARGGKHGQIIEAGPPDSSALYKRLMLPLEDDHHMPPEEKSQPSSSEIALIKYWIEEKATFDQPIAQFSSAKKITAIIKSLQQGREQSWIPAEPVGPASEESLQTLTALGLTALPLSKESNYRTVTFAGIPNITDEQIRGLLGIRDQLVSLDLNYTTVTDTQLEALAKLTNLRVLYLNYTQVSDAGLSKLSPLAELRLLSVVGAKVTDDAVPLISGFKKLTDLFLYQTQVTRTGIEKLQAANEKVKVDTGHYTLESLPTDTLVYKMTSGD